MKKEVYKPHPGKAYPLDLRLAVVKEYLSGHGSLKELGRKYKLPYPSIIASWVCTFGVDNINLHSVIKDKSKARIVTDKEKALR
jgi:transposase-like protein